MNRLAVICAIERVVDWMGDGFCAERSATDCLALQGEKSPAHSRLWRGGHIEDAYWGDGIAILHYTQSFRAARYLSAR